MKQPWYVLEAVLSADCLSSGCRKENQIYSAEEKAALAMYNFEENKRKEQKILGDMQRLVQSTLGDDEGEYEAPAGPEMPSEAAV